MDPSFDPTVIARDYLRSRDLHANAATMFGSLARMCELPTAQLLADELLAAGFTAEHIVQTLRTQREVIRALLESWENAVKAAAIARAVAAYRKAQGQARAGAPAQAHAPAPANAHPARASRAPVVPLAGARSRSAR